MNSGNPDNGKMLVILPLVILLTKIFEHIPWWGFTIPVFVVGLGLRSVGMESLLLLHWLPVRIHYLDWFLSSLPSLLCGSSAQQKCNCTVGCDPYSSGNHGRAVGRFGILLWPGFVPSAGRRTGFLKEVVVAPTLFLCEVGHS